MRSIRSNVGFTITELAVVMAITGAATMVAIQVSNNFVPSNRLAADYELLFGILNGARAEAITRGTSVLLCRSLDPSNATPACGGSVGGVATGWEHGILVYVAIDYSVAKVTYNSASHTLIKQFKLSGENTIKTNDVADDYTGFDADGSVVGDDIPVFSVCHDGDTASGKLISFNAVGRMVTSIPTTCTPAG